MTQAEDPRQCWSTPSELFAALYDEFHFTLDVAANKRNAKCDAFYTRNLNGLERPWAPERCWLNPPYDNIFPWLMKALGESYLGALVVALLPVRTDQAWFWDAVLGHAEIRFLRYRVRFEPPPGITQSQPREPSMLAIYRPYGARL